MRYLYWIRNIEEAEKVRITVEIHDVIEYSRKPVETIDEKGNKVVYYPSVCSGKIGMVQLEFDEKPTKKELKKKLDEIVKSWRTRKEWKL